MSRKLTVTIILCICICASALFVQSCAKATGKDSDGQPAFVSVPDDSYGAAGSENNGSGGCLSESGKDTSVSTGKHVRLTLLDDGVDVYKPLNDWKKDYRYSLSLMLDNGGIDAWFSSPGDGVEELDWVTYRHSDDWGNTWTDEKVVLTPSPCTPDALSICDPDAFYYDGYYYLGYTSTINKNEEGLCNSVFIARSKKPDGPYEKWNGSGWGGVPIPVVYFNGLEIGWGCGEPSFVVMEDTLYMYSTRDSFTHNNERLRVTEIRTADLTDPQWPSMFEYRGNTALVDKPEKNGEYSYEYADSWDVAYIEESHKFIALCTNRRFEDDSCLLYFESDDGVNFERVSEINRNVYTRCHNAGIMADGSGHIKKHDPVMVGYSYAGSNNNKWGLWCTRLAPAVIDYTVEADRSDDYGENLKEPMHYKDSTEKAAPLMLRTGSLTYRCAVGDKAFPISCYIRDNFRNESFIGNTRTRISNYDESIIDVNELNEIVPKSAGMTLATVEYNGLYREVSICVMPSNKYDSRQLAGFCHIVSNYDIKLNDPYIIKVRPMAMFEGWEMHELSNEEIIECKVFFISSDEKVCTVDLDGTVYPKGEGEAVINVVSGNGPVYDIKVKVSK